MFQLNYNTIVEILCSAEASVNALQNHLNIFNRKKKEKDTNRLNYPVVPCILFRSRDTKFKKNFHMV